MRVAQAGAGRPSEIDEIVIPSQFLRAALLATSVGACIYAFAVVFVAPDQPRRYLGPALLVLITGVAWVLLRLDRRRACSIVFAFGSWLVASVVAYANGGVHAPIVIAYPLVIIVAGWLLGWRFAIGLSGMTLLLLLGFAIGEPQGWLPVSSEPPPVLYWIAQSTALALSLAILAYLAHDQRARSLELQRIGGALESAERLRRNEILLDHTGRLAQVGGWEYEVESRRLTWTRETYRMLEIDPGLTPSVEMTLNLYPPDTRAKMEAAVLAAIREGKSFDLELEMFTGRGRPIWVRDVGEAELEGGKVVRITGAIQDVTAQVQVAQMMARSLENLRRTLDATGDAIYAYDYSSPSGCILFANDRLFELWGVPRDGGMPGDSRAVFAASLRCYVDPDLELHRIREIEAKPELYEDRVLLNDGRVIQRRSVAIPGVGPGARVWSFRDVTGQEKAFQALRDSEERLNQAQAVARLGHFDWDVETGTLAWSDELYRLWGLEPQSVTPTYALFRDAVHPDDLARFDALAKSVRSGDKTYDWTHRVVWRDGSVRFVHARGEVQFGSDGRIRRVIGTIQDLTERLLVEEELRAALRDAESANAAKNEFLSRMSHELRTPLNAILGFSQLLLLPDEVPLSQQQQENVKEIVVAGEHLLSQVDEVLDLSRVESGRIDLSLEGVPLGPLIESCMSLLRPIAVRSRVVLDAELRDVAVHADPMRLKQVVLNLISNAVKYNREGGLVRVRIHEAGERWRIEVEDSGRGISEEHISRLFRPFERLESPYDPIEGTGIGLALAKRLVEAMGGTIGVSSRLGVGSLFWFELPKAEALAVTRSGGLPKVGAGDTAANAGRARKVLHIEDNPANLKLMRAVLAARRDVELRDSGSAEGGLEIARSDPPDIVLLDLNLPGIDGFQALARLRTIPGLESVPVVAITANAMSGDVERGLAAGFSDYLTKPVDVARLNQVINSLLGAKAGRLPADAPDK